MPEHVRAWLYRISTAVVPLLVAYGFLTDDAAPLWLAVAAAALAAGPPALASVNTTTVKDDR